jgi:hypothetical protein
MKNLHHIAQLEAAYIALCLQEAPLEEVNKARQALEDAEGDAYREVFTALTGGETF